MIRFSTDESDTITEMLHKAPFKFHLTGSRYFGNSSSLSDTDYYTQYNEEVEKWLVTNGFRLLGQKSAYYWDLNTESVYRSHKTDIQLQKNIAKKHFAQVWLNSPSRRDKYLQTPKLKRTALWQDVYKIFDTMDRYPTITADLVNSGAIKVGGIYLPHI